VVGLKPVVSQHTLGRVKILSHEIMSVCVLQLMVAPPGEVMFLLSFPISFFLCQLQVCITYWVPQHLSSGFVLCLGCFEQLVMSHVLLVQ